VCEELELSNEMHETDFDFGCDTVGIGPSSP
jgi:hypothetical protein